MSTNIVQLHQVGIKDIDLVGGKNASLGEMLQHLTKLGVNIPNGFVITVNAYKEFIHFNDLDENTVIKTIKAIHAVEQKVARNEVSSQPLKGSLIS